MKHVACDAAAAVLVAVATASVAGGCSSSPSTSHVIQDVISSPALATVSGTVRVYGGPINTRTGKMGFTGNPAATVAPLVVRQGDRIALHSSTDSSGRYRVQLPAGTYTISAGCSGPVSVTVHAGESVTHDLPCYVP